MELEGGLERFLVSVGDIGDTGGVELSPVVVVRVRDFDFVVFGPVGFESVSEGAVPIESAGVALLTLGSVADRVAVFRPLCWELVLDPEFLRSLPVFGGFRGGFEAVFTVERAVEEAGFTVEASLLGGCVANEDLDLIGVGEAQRLLDMLALRGFGRGKDSSGWSLNRLMIS